MDTAHNNKEALSRYENHPYDVVLTDMQHPEELGSEEVRFDDGLELARAIRKKNPSQRIGFITARGTDIPDYPTLHKAFRVKLLVTFVEVLCQQS